MSYACDSLEQCLKDIEIVAQPGGGITVEERELASKVLAFKERAIPGLLDYLKHDNKEVRDLSAYILRDIEGLNERHLNSLINANNGWLPPAIARIGTGEAVEFLMSELVKEKSSESQVSYSIKILGRKAIPYLVEFYNCQGNCDETLLYVVGNIFDEMGKNALAAIPPLVKIISNENSDPIARKMAERAIIKIGGIEAVIILKQKINKFTISSSVPNNNLFIEIASLGEDATEIGEVIQKYYSSNIRNTSIFAIRTVGYIGYKDAALPLVSMLRSEDDWLKIYVAVESLGRLKDIRAVESLIYVRDYHWYPPVREAAAKAIKVINGEDTYEPPLEGRFFNNDFLKFMWIDTLPIPCNSVKYPVKHYRPDVKFRATIHKTIAEHFVYMKAIDTFGDKSGNIKYYSTTPDVGIKVEDGWIIGNDRGEWGGELVHWKSENDYYLIIEDNIKDIFDTHYGIIAVGGLAHLDKSRGVLYKLSKSDNNRWTAEAYKYLPGAAYSSQMLEDERLLLNTTGGSVIFSPEKGFEMAECIN